MPQVSLEEYEAIAHNNDPLGKLVENFAPHIVGLDRAKIALILTLASGHDTRKSRQRIHTILSGPPGTAKTDLLRAAAAEAGATLYGPRMSTGGITVDFRTQKVGIISTVNDTTYQLLALDELEKFDDEVLENLLTSMESGTFSYAGGGRSGVVPAHIRIVAASNKATDLSPELLDRFDFHVKIPLPNRGQAHRVVHKITSTYLQDDDEQPPIPIPGDDDAPIVEHGFVREYLDQARTFDPKFPEEERGLAELIFKMLVDNEPEDKIKLRPYRGILRTAYALARIHNQNVTAEMILKSVEILHPDWQPTQLSNIRSLLDFRAERKALSRTDSLIP